MSRGLVDKSTGSRIPTAGNIVDKVGDLTALHTTAKNKAVNAINEVADAVNAVESALAGKADTDIVAADFNAGTSYTTDNYCVQDGKLYRFKNNHSGAWSASDVEEVKIAGELATLKSGLTNVQSDVKLNTQDLTTPSRTKNILPMTLSGIKSANTTGTWNGNVYTDNGVTFTVQTDVDGNITKITANGTAPATNTSLILASNADLAKLANNSVILNGSIGGASDTYLIVADHWNGDNSSASRDGDSVAFTPTSAFNKVEIVILNRYAPSNVEFYPMLRPATITNPTFAPYIPSVESRIEAVERNDFSSATDIKDYNASDNMFIAPNDGYIVAETTNSVIVRLYGSANAYVNIKIDVSNNNYLYIKKGMKAYVFSNANNDAVYFIPLT